MTEPLPHEVQDAVIAIGEWLRAAPERRRGGMWTRLFAAIHDAQARKDAA